MANASSVRESKEENSITTTPNPKHVAKPSKIMAELEAAQSAMDVLKEKLSRTKAEFRRTVEQDEGRQSEENKKADGWPYGITEEQMKTLADLEIDVFVAETEWRTIKDEIDLQAGLVKFNNSLEDGINRLSIIGGSDENQESPSPGTDSQHKPEDVDPQSHADLDTDALIQRTKTLLMETDSAIEKNFPDTKERDRDSSLRLADYEARHRESQATIRVLDLAMAVMNKKLGMKTAETEALTEDDISAVNEYLFTVTEKVVPEIVDRLPAGSHDILSLMPNLHM